MSLPLYTYEATLTIQSTNVGICGFKDEKVHFNMESTSFVFGTGVGRSSSMKGALHCIGRSHQICANYLEGMM